MNELEADERVKLLEYHQDKVRDITTDVNGFFEDQNAIIALQKSVLGVAGKLIALYDQNPGAEFVFIVGGKSRTLTETMLGHVVKLLPEDHPAILAIKNRIRLNDDKNKSLYGTTTLMGERKDGVIIPPEILKFKKTFMEKLTKRKTLLVIFDDHMNSGKKAYTTVKGLVDKGLLATYIVFTANPDPDSYYLRPKGWEKFQDDVFVGTTDKGAAELISGISKLLSYYANLRLNKDIKLGISIPAEIGDLNEEHAKDLRNSVKLRKRLDSIL